MTASSRQGWAFWAVNRWLGVFTKYHWIREDGLTACGRTPHDEHHGSNTDRFVFDDNPSDRDKCKRCVRVLQVRQG